jgi:hypothetical protein
MTMTSAPMVEVPWHQTKQFARNVALFQNLKSVATAPQLLDEMLHLRGYCF